MRPALLVFLLGASAIAGAASPEPGLLFYLSGAHQLDADYAASGQTQPNVARGVTLIDDGVRGPALQCANSQVLAYWAPGNIYAQRGTVSFFWRSRDPVGPTEFPIFRVAFADHTSWDMVWLRIDYNGHGFDAFVTDASLARTRLSVAMQPFAGPQAWTHLAFSWDENHGIRFYVNGRLAAAKEGVAMLDTGLDQFGPHSRIISPHQVQSAYAFTRGGDLDELRIYDRMLADENIATLAKGDAVTDLPPLPTRNLADVRSRDEWWLRYGWNRPGDPPPYLAGNAISVRKVEIHETYDMKRWGWKATDGIRETTWPGVYNRSRLPGRYDYFTLPDWDCYVEAGKAITFVMPDEPWNHLEISGAAWGRMEMLPAGTDGETAYLAHAESQLFERAKGNERTVHRLAAPIVGRKIRFTNVEQEEPIGELSAYNVTAGREPAGTARLSYRLTAATPDAGLGEIVDFINRRHPADERAMLVARPAGARFEPTPARQSSPSQPSLPVVHVLIPDNWDEIDGGLDGVAIDLPALNVKPTHGEFFPLNLQVKDPSWLYRNALDFSFSVKPGEAKTLWLDLRDRIMPVGKGFFLTLAGAGADFNAAMLEGAQIRLVFKPREAARPEHEIDRFTQLRDNYAMMAEEHPSRPGLNLWNRYSADLKELIRVNPNHDPGKYYAAASGLGPLPPAQLGTPPVGVPLWALRQVELLGRYKRFVNWYIDHRQVAFGDFGGGLSDDDDLTNLFPGLAFMGADPEKLAASLRLTLEAIYRNGMFTNGICTIQTDDLHSFEEGTTALGQNLILNYGSPRQLERAMESERGVETITGVNAAGHRHIMSSYFSATKVALDGPWGWVKPNCYMMLQPSELLVEFNGSPAAKKFLLEIADGVLAHRKVDPATGRGTLPASIHFVDDAEGGAGFTGGGGAAFGSGGPVSFLFWTAWTATGQRKYLDPVLDSGLLSVNANLLDIFALRNSSLARESAAGPTFVTPPSDDPVIPDASAGARGFAARGGRGGRGGGGRQRGGGNPLTWQLTGEKSVLERDYTASIEEFDAKEYIYTKGNLWIDRVFAEGSRTAELQKTRLGGVVHSRNDLLSGHVVSWKFHAPANEQSAAFLIPDATPTGFKVIAYNLETTPVSVAMTGWNIDPGIWEIAQGVDANNDDIADETTESRSVPFEKTTSVEITLPPRATTILTLKRKTPGKPYWQRPDVGIDREDVVVEGNKVHVTVHSVGSVDSPATTLSLVDQSGRTLGSAPVPAMKAPLDLTPKTTTVTLMLPADAKLAGGSVVLDPDGKVTEITRLNNRVQF